MRIINISVTRPPKIAPSNVLFGDILLSNGFFPKTVPKKYEKVSLNQITQKKKIRNLEFILLSINKFVNGKTKLNRQKECSLKLEFNSKFLFSMRIM